MDIISLTNQLAEIVGPEHVTAAPSVAPGSREELAHVLAVAHAAHMPVQPYGGGTQQRWGGPLGDDQALTLYTTRLKRVLDYTPDDLTISVEAGLTVAELQSTLAVNGQMLPLDMPLAERATVGGMLATAMDSPRRLGYGTARDLLIGIGVVEATGRASKAGGMVVKNVSGFDMMKLYIGSMGSLAVIVSANFKLYPRPRVAASLRCTFPSQAAAFALAHSIAASPLTPVAVEYIESAMLTQNAPSLVVAAEGLPAAVERHIRDVGAMAARAGALTIASVHDELHHQLWGEIGLLAQTAQIADDTLVARLSCLPADLERAIDQACSRGTDRQVSLEISARALSGVAYLRLSGPDASLRAWHSAMLANWPNLAILAAPPTLADLSVWGRSIANIELMRRIKQEFDPENLLNPGRFIV